MGPPASPSPIPPRAGHRRYGGPGNADSGSDVEEGAAAAAAATTTSHAKPPQRPVNSLLMWRMEQHTLSLGPAADASTCNNP
eukprot:XP_001690660.1 predicted protein [Chlamydomonas reinhardtii]